MGLWLQSPLRIVLLGIVLYLHEDLSLLGLLTWLSLLNVLLSTAEGDTYPFQALNIICSGQDTEARGDGGE
jgi:hypothetical protein